MPPKDPLIRHAITPPAFDPRNAIHRERLVDAIHGQVPRKLIAVAAPAGYGKTTLLADFAAHTDLTVCWARLSEADWDVMRFANLLAASLQNRFRRLKGEPDLEALASSSPEALGVAFAGAIDEQIGETFVIALDDVHLINRSKPVMALLDRLLSELPDQVTVVAAGREVLESSVLAQLMAEGDLAGFGPHDLALTRNELIKLTEALEGQQLPAADIDRLLEESRGWVTGIVLSGQVADLRSGTLIAGGKPMVYEYLASVVLNRQPDDLRRFALDAAVLPVMTSSACDEVLGRDDSRKYLGQLERRNLFVTPTETSPKTYEFHPQFRDFLLESLQSADPKRLARLRRRAADFYVESRSPELAVDLLIDAGSISRAAKLAESSSSELIDQGRVQTLEAWAERFRAHAAPVPNLLLRLASAALNRGRLGRAEELLREVEGFISAKSTKDIQARYYIARGFMHLQQGRHEAGMREVTRIEAIFEKRANRRLLSIANRLKALIMLRSEKSVRAAEQTLERAVAELESIGDRYLQMTALVDLATAQHVLGKAPEVRATRRRVLSLARSIGAPLPLAVALSNSARDAYEQGDVQRALELSQEGLKFARQAASPLWEAVNLMRQAHTFNDIALVLQAAELYDRALTIFIELDAVPWIRFCCISTSTLHRRWGNPNTAREWIKRALVLDEQKEHSLELRIELAAVESLNSPDKALKVLRSVINQTGAKLEADAETLVHYFLGQAGLRVGDIDKAEASFSQMINLAGIHRTEQYAAAELLVDGQAMAYLRESFDTNPTVRVILNRVESMRAFAAQYQAPTAEADLGSELKIQAFALGRAQLIVNGRENTTLKPLNREVFLCLLDNQSLTKEELTNVFWPGLPEGRRVASLHTAISSIRRELGKSTVQFDGTTYSIDPNLPIEYDVRRFEQATAVVEGLPPGDPRRMFALTEAKNLYQGTFMPESTADWTTIRRSELEMRFLDVLANFGYEAIVSDQPVRALGALKAALDIDPYRDDVNFNYLDALGRLGRRGEAVAHYQAYVRLLSTELGLDPPDRTRTLYDRLIS